jgi:hypothetical protein
MGIEQTDALLRLAAWRDAAAWLDYTALEFVADETTRGYLFHVAQCQRDEAERRYATLAGLDPVIAS